MTTVRKTNAAATSAIFKSPLNVNGEDLANNQDPRPSSMPAATRSYSPGRFREQGLHVNRHQLADEEQSR
jgi:hypothetical protein